MSLDRRAEMKRDLMEKTKDAYQHRNESGMFGDIFLDVEGLQKWKSSQGVHLIDTIPYRAGDKNPKTKEGKWTYVLEIFVHRGVGVTQDTFLCPALTYKRPCPICEYREKLRGEEGYDEDLVKSLYPKYRSIYNIICYDSPQEEAKGIQVWDVSFHFMEKKLLAIAKLPDKLGGGYTAFSDPDEGKMIQFEQKGTRDVEFLGHQFLPRDYKFAEEVLDQAFCLDQIINIPSYEDLESAFFADEEGSPVEESAKEQIPEKEEPVIEKQHSAQTVDVGSPTDRRVRQRAGVKVCQAGGTFGADCESFDLCRDCPDWDECSSLTDQAKAKAAEEEKKKAPPQPEARKPIRQPIKREETKPPERQAPKTFSRRGASLGKR